MRVENEFIKRTMRVRWSWYGIKNFNNREISIIFLLYRKMKETWPIEWDFQVSLWRWKFRVYRIEETELVWPAEVSQ